MAWRADEVSEMFQAFAAHVIRHHAIDFHPHNIADLLDVVEIQRESGNDWSVGQLNRVEAEAADFDDDDPLSDFADVAFDEVCLDIPVDSVFAERNVSWPELRAPTT